MIVIAGGPKCGKTTLAKKLADPTFATDDLLPKGLAWSDQSNVVLKRMREPKISIIEGVTTVRALRKWLRVEPALRPRLDRVIWMPTPFVAQTPRQRALWKGCTTIWHQIARPLALAGVVVQVGD